MGGQGPLPPQNPPETPPPAGLSPTGNGWVAQSADGSQIAGYDNVSRTWTVQSPPPGFYPEPGADGSLRYVNQSTGQTITFTGSGWSTDDNHAVTHVYDPGSGQTAYQDPKTHAWEVHDPPDGFVVDDSVPTDQLGYHFKNADGRTATFNPYDRQWQYSDSHGNVPLRTQERPGTGDDAGRVPVDVDPATATPPDDTGTAATAKDSIASSRLEALRRGDDSVPHGQPSRDYQTDVDNLAAAKAQLARMVRDGADPNALAIMETHVADLTTYVARWNDYQDDLGHFAHGGATAVNDAAQNDDLTTLIRQAGDIGESAGDLGLGAVAPTIEGSIPEAPTRPGTSGTTRTAPATQAVGEPEAEGPVADGRAAEPGQDVEAPPLPGHTDTQSLPPEPAAGTPHTDTQLLPPERAVRADADTHVGDGPTGTQAGRPTPEDLQPFRDAAQARQAVETPQDAAKARQAAADRAARKSGFADKADMDVRINEARQRANAKHLGDPDLIDQGPNESPEQAADRYARAHSLTTTQFDPSDAAVNMAGARKLLEGVVDGTITDVPATPATVKALFDRYQAARKVVTDGQARFPDYWDRVPSDTRALLQSELTAGEGRDLGYWLDRLNDAPADGAVGTAAAAGIGAAAGASGAAGLGVGGTAIGGVPAAIGRRSGDGWQRAAAIGVAALLVVGVGGATALGYGPFAGKPVSVTESQPPRATATASQGAVGETQAGISEEPTEATSPEPTAGLDLSKIQWMPTLQATSDQIPGNPHCRILVGIDVNFIALGSDGDEDQALIDAIVGKTAVVTMSGPDLPHQITVEMVRQGSNVGKFGDVTAATGGATYQATVVSVGNIQLNVKSDTFVNPCNN